MVARRISSRDGRQLTLRPVLPDDADFLYHVYASTRADEMALLTWTPAEKQAFLLMQFRAQLQGYRARFPHAGHFIILQDNQSTGRLIVDRSGGAILLVDIAILPEFRNAGVGTSLIRFLQREAMQAGCPLKLHVDASNPARRLYERLGFQKIDTTGIYDAMEWRLASPEAAKDEPANQG